MAFTIIPFGVPRRPTTGVELQAAQAQSRIDTDGLKGNLFDNNSPVSAIEHNLTVSSSKAKDE